MSWAEARARFPVLERHAYLNAGSFGPLSRATLDAVETLRAWEGEHGRGGGTYFDDVLARRGRVRGLLAGELGVPADRVALVLATTHAVQVVVSGLALGSDDEVVTTDSEHFGLLGPLLASGARVRIARVREFPAADVFDAVSKLVTPRTRLLALSAVSWLDGKVFPWRELREATGVPALVDGAQAVGAVPVDVAEADFYTVSAQKWLCGPDGTGALYVRDPDALPARLVSGLSAEVYDLVAGTWEPKAGAARFDPLFIPAASLAGLEAALTDPPAGRFARARELTEHCRGALIDAGLDVVTESEQSTLVSFRPPTDPAETVRALFDQGVVVRDLPGTGLVRASVGWWNDESDVERLVAGLRA